jgi:hypothetical protein
VKLRLAALADPGRASPLSGAARRAIAVFYPETITGWGVFEVFLQRTHSVSGAAMRANHPRLLKRIIVAKSMESFKFAGF